MSCLQKCPVSRRSVLGVDIGEIPGEQALIFRIMGRLEVCGTGIDSRETPKAPS